MVILYLDIETFSEKEFKPDGTKIISIQYKDANGVFNILKEWESDEKTVLKSFYDYLKQFEKETIMIIGHNILRFDIPLLIHRMTLHKIDSTSNLMDLFHNVFVIDSMQCLLPFNEFRFKGLSAEDLARKLKIREPKHKSKEIDGFYREKKFDKIEEHIIADMNFIEDLWWTLRRERDKLKLLIS